MKEKVEVAIRMLKGQGHTVNIRVREGGKQWFEIDGRMLASWDEIQNLADGVYSLDELEDLFKRRQAEEQSKP
jgi:hypothetical protein